MKKLWIFILILIAAAAGFVYFSPMFEKEPPKIEILTNGYTNLQKPIKIIITDNSGIKSYEVELRAGNFDEIIAKSAEPNMGKKVVLNLKLPNIDAKQLHLSVVATDTSKWHFFRGNSARRDVVLVVDKTAPDAEVINNSYAIGRGGSAAAVVKVNDENLKEKYILVNNKYRFNLTPFVKKGYYAALIAWPYNETEFNAELIAVDKAGNESQVHIPYYWKTKGIYRLKNKKIKITDGFIENVAKRVLIKSGLKVPNDPVETFKVMNEKLRKMNEKELFNLTRNIYESKINSFYINRFNPLPGSALQAGFMELRHYYYKGREISRAVHKGMDLAKIKHAKVYASNTGTVIATKYIGIYGNTMVVYHKLGLYTTYSHLSQLNAKKGEKVRRGQVIARTGSTGGVFGDHLHFGVYIQGYPVQPREWMDSRWIRLNIIKVIKDAKRTVLQ